MIGIIVVTVTAGAGDAEAIICVRPEGCGAVPYYLANPPDYRRYGPIYCRRFLVDGVWTRRCWRLNKPETPAW